jgi:hypothetical protein
MNKEEIINILKEYMGEIPIYATISNAIDAELSLNSMYIEGDADVIPGGTTISFPLVQIIKI